MSTDLVTPATDAALSSWDASVAKGDYSESAATKAVTTGLNAAAATAGAVAATAACTATGVGAAVAPLCGLLGGVIGQKIIGPIVSWIGNAAKSIGHFFSSLFEGDPPPPILVGPSDATPVLPRDYIAQVLTSRLAMLILSTDQNFLDGVNQLVALHASLGIPGEYDALLCIERLHFDQRLVCAVYHAGEFDPFIAMPGVVLAQGFEPAYIQWPVAYGPVAWHTIVNAWLAADDVLSPGGLGSSGYLANQAGLALKLGMVSSIGFTRVAPSLMTPAKYQALNNIAAAGPAPGSAMATLFSQVQNWRTRSTQALAREAISLAVAGALGLALGSRALELATLGPTTKLVGTVPPPLDGIYFQLRP